MGQLPGSGSGWNRGRQTARVGPEARAPGGAGQGRNYLTTYQAHSPHPQASDKRSKFSKYGLQPASRNYQAHPPSVTPEHQAAWLGPPAPALVTTGSASRVSHKEIPSSQVKGGWKWRQKSPTTESPHLLRLLPREEGS